MCRKTILKKTLFLIKWKKLVIVNSLIMTLFSKISVSYTETMVYQQLYWTDFISIFSVK